MTLPKGVALPKLALGRGIKYNADLGVNPFKYGFVGGIDSHNGTPSNVEEDNFAVGNHGYADQTAEIRSTSVLEGEMQISDVNPGALIAIWAESNTRGAIWESMRAKETFATSGPRTKVRVFAAQGFAESYDSYDAMVTDGYAKGVPMGGDYTGTEAPQFLVWAMKDPIGPNLDRIQIIKGWYENGEMKDTIYDVAASGDRLQADGSVTPVDAPINMETGEFNTEKGDLERMTVWTDPDWPPDIGAFYYAHRGTAARLPSRAPRSLHPAAGYRVPAGAPPACRGRGRGVGSGARVVAGGRRGPAGPARQAGDADGLGADFGAGTGKLIRWRLCGHTLGAAGRDVVRARALGAGDAPRFGDGKPARGPRALRLRLTAAAPGRDADRAQHPAGRRRGHPPQGRHLHRECARSAILTLGHRPWCLGSCRRLGEREHPGGNLGCLRLA
ncbi:DUF3604 domain-containing protein [Alloyangia pacifica]|uniref:DUF3604 domain-containing protein n=1 Tax=Alloyangia pacifica TaxID=311180 RepID=UPI00131EDBDD|nr:DUF3604 domain-containing protein [Alloyangia pacifica]